MPTVTFDIAANSENGYEQGGTWTDTVPYFGLDPTAVEPGFRWNSVTVPNGATITSAKITFRARSLTGTVTDIHGKVRGHKGDAPAFQNGVFSPNVGTTLTTASPDWDPSAWVTDTYYDVTVTTVVQEIVNAAGWSSGSDMALFVFDDGTAASTNLAMYRFNDGDTAASRLEITYTTADVTIDQWQFQERVVKAPTYKVVASGFTPPDKIN